MAKVGGEFSSRFCATVVGIFCDIRTEIRIQAFDSVKRGFHVISEQKVIENLVVHAGHQRRARAFEGDTNISAFAIQLNPMTSPTGLDFDEAEVLREVLARAKILFERGNIVLLKWITPIVAEFARVADLLWHSGRCDQCHRIVLAIYADESRQHLRSSRIGRSLVVFQFGHQRIRPHAVLSLKAMEGRERDHLVGAKLDRRALSPRSDWAAFGCDVS